MKAASVMFVTYGAGHADIVASLLPAFAAQGFEKPLVLALTTAPARIDPSLCRLSRCADYLPMPGYEDAMERGADLARSFWVEGSEVPWQETCAYLGISYRDLETDLGPSGARDRYRALGRQAFCPTHFLEKVLSAERPDIVVVTCNVRMERAAILAARRLGIRSVLIEDLLGYSLLGRYPYGERGSLVAKAEWPDMAVTMNAQIRDILIQNGFPGRRVAALGQPAISDWFRQVTRRPDDGLRERLATGKPVVTYITTPRDELLVPQTKTLIDLAYRRPDLTFVIKLHPSTHVSKFGEGFGPFPANIHLLSKEPALEVVKLSDVVILYRSTVGIACLATSTPMIVWSDLGEPEVLPYVASGGAVEVTRNQDLEIVIDTALRGGKGSAYRRPHPLFEVGPNSGNAVAAWLAAGAPEVAD